jgi:tripartite-type tricarboxylate transporter receptor subunit TctC
MKRGYRVLLMVLGVNLAHALAAAGAMAQYPNKPIRFILPFPGGATDFLGRVVGQRLAEALGQPVVIDNRPGAGGNLGIEIAARSAPDGYTLVLVAPNITISPSLYRKLNYDPVRDFAPVTPVATVTMVIITHPALPAQTLKEFIALAKSKPGQLNYGSGGSGTSLHLAGELFKITAGVDLVHVPYKGASVAMNDVIGGRLDSLFIGIPAPAPHIKAGRLRGLAVLAPQRSPVLPEVPTATEAGLPGFEVTTWYGVLAPAGTPKDIVARLNREIVKIMNTPDTKERLAVVAADPMTSSPEQFATYIKQEIARWSKVVRTAGLRAD